MASMAMLHNRRVYIYMEKDVIKMDLGGNFGIDLESCSLLSEKPEMFPLVTIIYLRLVGAQTLPSGYLLHSHGIDDP